MKRHNAGVILLLIACDLAVGKCLKEIVSVTCKRDRICQNLGDHVIGRAGFIAADNGFIPVRLTLSEIIRAEGVDL